MRFTVVWEPTAQDTLAELWLTSYARDSVTRAADQIEKLLRAAPGSSGEPISEGLWKVSIPPLTVVYEVSIVDLLVKVVLVRRDA